MSHTYHKPCTLYQASFNFSNVDMYMVINILKKLNINKAMGYDGLLTKCIKIAAPKLVSSLAFMINRCINDCVFPNSLNIANMFPLFKNKDAFTMENYSSLWISKEGVLNDQLQKYFDNILSILL